MKHTERSDQLQCYKTAVFISHVSSWSEHSEFLDAKKLRKKIGARMLFKVMMCLFLLAAVSARQSGLWKKIASYKCISGKNNHYNEFEYAGQSTFIIALKLVHKQGEIGCAKQHSSYWGCGSAGHENIIITDTRNKRIYPSPALVSLGDGGWYDLPGYGQYSPELVFSDPGFHYLYKGQRLRIWYGEDLYGYTEDDNHGHTCMDVYAYSPNI